VPRGPIETTRSNPVGLTDRQLEVLTLMVAGLSNGEIAEKLWIAKKTVEHHVAAIFAMLDVDSRSKASTTARDMSLQK
jgi:DNA-binding NarL/FixJ family response regulator